MITSYYRTLLLISLLTPAIIYSQGFSVKSLQKINNAALSGSPLEWYDGFGGGVEVIGDVDGDGIDDVAVGAFRDDDGGTDKGAVYILMLNANGTVKAQQKISSTTGNGPVMATGQIYFGIDVASLGDLNGDGFMDIAVASRADDGTAATGRGAVFILFLDNTGQVLEYQKISNTEGGGPGTLDANDYFGQDVRPAGDMNGDGLPDLLISANGDDDGGANLGAVYIANLDYNGMAKSIQKISSTVGGFTGTIDAGDLFSRGLSKLGDVDGDGINDIAVGALLDDDGGTDRGAIYILFMNSDGTVKSHQKISDTQGGFTGTLDNQDYFGICITPLSDLDGDGIDEIGVGAYYDDDGVANGGAMWILYLNADGTVKQHDKLGCDDPLLISQVVTQESFMSALSFFGDRDADGIIDILVGAYWGNDGSISSGEVFVLHLDSQVTNPPEMAYRSTPEFITSVQKYSDVTGEPLVGQLGNSDYFGISSCGIGDLDEDGINDMVVGSFCDDDGGTNRGAVYVLFLNANGTIKSYQKISDTQGGFTGILNDQDRLGVSVCSLGDLDGDGVTDIAVGAYLDDDGASNAGSVYVLFLNTNGTVKSHQKISNTQGGFTGSLAWGDYFGSGLTSPGDINNDGVVDLVVGAAEDDDGTSNSGSLWVLFLNTNGTVQSHQKISNLSGGFGNILDSYDGLGWRVSSMGDTDYDGVPDIVVGARKDDEAGVDAGTIYLLNLNTDGTVKTNRKITSGLSDFTGLVRTIDWFGQGVEGGYDMNEDGINDILIGNFLADDGGTNRGGVFLLLMNADGSVKSHKIIGPTTGHLTQYVSNDDRMGSAVSVVDYNSTTKKVKIAIGVYTDDDGFTDAGGVYLVEIDMDVCDYTELVINTIPLLPDSIPFDLTIDGETQSFTTGGVENWEIYEPDYVGLGVLSVIGTADYDSLDIIFDINKCSIEDIRIIVDTSGTGTKDTLSLDSNFFQVNNYQELILFAGDTSESSSGDSLLYSLDLQGGLGFSPDGDSNYDVLAINGLDNISQFSITIIDLDENVVFTSTDKNDFWNGKYMNTGTLQPVGAYNYSIEINGDTYVGQLLVNY